MTEELLMRLEQMEARVKYNHLMRAARDCFCGTVPVVWANADRLVRAKFRRDERALCISTSERLQVNALHNEELTFLIDMLDADREGQEHPFNSDLHAKLSQWRLENSLVDVEAPEPELEPVEEALAEPVEEETAVELVEEQEVA